MPVPERDEALPRAVAGVPTGVPAGLSMRDLLASCAAAREVSTPPRLPAPPVTGQHRPAETVRPATVRRAEAA
ncbi:hypothetical protein ACFV6E_39170 [Streptomyces sp. NPDC059785]|uniref:hypothetical protein n=1 Tax=unclassified Streptomyces TaxID=2593676 RepID=UPI00366405C0